MRGLPGQPEMRVWDEAKQQLQIGNKCEKLKKSYGAIMTVYRGGKGRIGRANASLSDNENANVHCVKEERPSPVCRERERYSNNGADKQQRISVSLSLTHYRSLYLLLMLLLLHDIFIEFHLRNG